MHTYIVAAKGDGMLRQDLQQLFQTIAKNSRGGIRLPMSKWITVTSPNI